MTEAELEARFQKFRRRAPSIKTQEHLDRIVASFPPEHRAVAIERTSGMLRSDLVPREDVVEVKIKDLSNPNVTEQTVMRLNQQAAKIIEQADTMAEMDKRIKELEKELADERQKEKR